MLDLNLVTPQPKFICDLFPVGEVSILASKPGIGKTFLILGLLLDYVRKNEEDTVILFSGENSQSLIFSRLSKINASYHDHRNVFKNFELVNQEEDGVLFVNVESDFETICNLLSYKKPKITVFDSFLCFHSLDENKASDMITVFNLFRDLARKYQTSIVCTHHLRKSTVKNKSDQDEIIGSSVITRLSAVCYNLFEFNRNIYLKCVKSWYQKPPVYKYSIETISDTEVEIFLTPESFLLSYESFLEFLEKMPKNETFTQSYIRSVTGWNKASVSRYMMKAESDKKIVPIIHGTRKTYKKI